VDAPHTGRPTAYWLVRVAWWEQHGGVRGAWGVYAGASIWGHLDHPRMALVGLDWGVDG